MLPHDLPAHLRSDLEAVIGAARTAGERALAVRATGRWKEEGILADVGDQGADGFLQGFLRGRFPDDAILSEETADTSARLASPRTWIVDPLDGTREYSQHRSDWAVHVALVIAGRPVLGVVGLPAQDRILWGAIGNGRSWGGVLGAGSVARGDSREPVPPRIAVSRSHTPSWMPSFAAEIGGTQVHSGSVGNKVALLLLGEADVYAHRKGLKEWDTCAPEIVARALGWSVSRLGGAELVYNQPDPRVDEFLVCRPAARERVLTALRNSGAVASAS
ncbi:MAG: 3'(2'),5'-bisphosphate nucleotidase CysQ [Planctomycetota bacterium]|nr:3'(2'),5'-bisphosphate nucleotidase CysQ [Planctomycetota bacterium]